MHAHLLVMYPPPKDPQAFDRKYREEHLPYAGPRLKGATGVATLHVLRTPTTASPYHAISDISFPSVEALEECAASAGGKEALAHAASISTGGAPVIVVVKDE